MMKGVANTILMVRPVHFHYNSETAVNNYYQHEIDGLDNRHAQNNARREFDAFVEKLRQAGVEVVVVEDTEGADTPDSIFPNNWVSFHPNGAAILYPMYAENRRRERRMDILEHLRQAHSFSIDQIIDLSHFEKEDIFLEGTGSLVLDRVNKVAYAALSPRTDEKIVHEFCERIMYTPISFTAYQSVGQERLPIYHTNVMMCVGRSFAVICAESIDDSDERKMVLARLEADGKEVVLITEEQVRQFAGNMLEVGPIGEDNRSILAMSESAFNSLTSDQVEQLEKHAKLVYSPLNTIEALGGGSARCMMAEVFLPLKAQIHE